MADSIQTYVETVRSLKVGGLPEGADALVVSQAVQQSGGLHMFVARDDARAAAFMEAAAFFAPDMKLIHIPAWDCLPYDRISPSASLAARRASGLHMMLEAAEQNDTALVVTTIKSMDQRVPPKTVMSGSGLSARVGSILKHDELLSYLGSNGYSRVSVVVERGDFAIRGGIIDIFPPELEEPVRLDFFGDELESIRAFDPETQRTKRQLDTLVLSPVSEVTLSEGDISRFRRNYVGAFGGGISQDPVYASVSEGIRPQGIEHFLPLFYETLDTLFDYLPSESLIILDNLASEALEEHRKQVADYYEARQDAIAKSDSGGAYRVLPPDRLYMDQAEWKTALSNRKTRRHHPFDIPPADDVLNFDGRASRSFAPERQAEKANVFDAVSQHVSELKSQGRRVLMAAWSEGSMKRLGGVLDDHGLLIAPLNEGQGQDAVKPGQARLAVLPLEDGFVLDDLYVLSETDILGDRLVTRSHKRRAKNFISDAASLQEGDLVVHIDHGIGQYKGLRTISVQGNSHDCVEIAYAGDDKLLLPVQNIELLSRYGSTPETVFLDRLGGAAWQARKSKAKQRLKDLAEGLIKIAAQRELRKADVIEVPDGIYDEFCARFPYTETDDQLDAVEDVTGDLGSGRPMDRLICGDVGFGKTEVALRAAFITAMSGRQVAVIAPTTVLARQHFETFSKRFKGWPIKVRQLSRLVSSAKATQTKEAMAKGQVDIVIGTHALLAKTVKFSDLGLLVIDEEQRFGVKHKERLKSLKADVHVLTLTATPIPRTLQMALSGIRELSLISTPPVDRLAVRTYVSPFDPVTIREALLREKYRGGQNFFVVPRIKDIGEIEEFLRDRVPEVSYVIAHGQMAGGQLEDVMTAFYDGKYDVLVSTSIIESGIDIPTANTMIIHRADRFGLAQLYQMRGRVGRSKIRAYAYLTLPEGQVPTPGAEQRLKLLHSLDTLGAGFTLASHDLDMRGGGNLLGDEQSGHIKDLGVELYQAMLEEAVAELKDGEDHVEGSWSPIINVGVSLLIPESYVEDLNIRMSLYRRLAEVESEQDSEAFAAELIDRFGPLPDEVSNLLNVMSIKRWAKDAGIEKVDAGPKGAVITIKDGAVDDPSRILQFLSESVNWRLRPDQTLFLAGHFEDDVKRLSGVKMAVKKLQSYLAKSA